jgi:hypothetical protein
LTWTLQNGYVIGLSPVTRWDNYIYKATGLISGDYLRIWYSTYNRTGYTEAQLTYTGGIPTLSTTRPFFLYGTSSDVFYDLQVNANSALVLTTAINVTGDLTFNGDLLGYDQNITFFNSNNNTFRGIGSCIGTAIVKTPTLYVQNSLTISYIVGITTNLTTENGFSMRVQLTGSGTLMITELMLSQSLTSWSASSSTISVATFTLSGLESGRYQVYIDGIETQILTSSGGIISFTYSGPWSEHQFEIEYLPSFAEKVGDTNIGLFVILFIIAIVSIGILFVEYRTEKISIEGITYLLIGILVAVTILSIAVVTFWS